MTFNEQLESSMIECCILVSIMHTRNNIQYSRTEMCIIFDPCLKTGYNNAKSVFVPKAKQKRILLPSKNMMMYHKLFQQNFVHPGVGNNSKDIKTRKKKSLYSSWEMKQEHLF